MQEVFEAELEERQKKNKKINHNKKTFADPKKRLMTYGEYKLLYANKPDKIKLWCLRLADELLEWVKQKRLEEDPLCSYTIEEFYLLRDIPQQRWNEWIKDCKELSDAVDNARLYLGITREMRGLRDKDNVNMIKPVQWHYSPVWDNTEIRQAKLKNDLIENTGTKYILVEKDPESELVTQKLKLKDAS